MGFRRQIASGMAAAIWVAGALFLAAPALAQSQANDAPRAAPTTAVWTVPSPAQPPQSANADPGLRPAMQPRYAVMADGAQPAPGPQQPAAPDVSPPSVPAVSQPAAAAPVSGFRGPHYSVMQGPSSAVLGSPSRNLRAAPTDAYTLGTGDKLRVTVYGEPDLSGDFDVGSAGEVRLPLIGQVHAAGLTVHGFEQSVTAKLAGRYLLHPRVSAEVIDYRPFFIIGEVNKPGQYPYVNGMNVLTAVALAGGYTYRADDSDVYVRRDGSTKEVERPADETTKIHPGDIIRVGERFF